jgi:hypothetical protein
VAVVSPTVLAIDKLSDFVVGDSKWKL